MAGIEKVCEVDGDHCGWDMYGWKRNSLQVKPEHRPLFKGKEATVYVHSSELRFKYRSGASMLIGETDLNKDGKLDRSKPYAPKGGKLVRTVEYMMHVPDVPGTVGGKFYNSTFDWRATKHNLRKLLGLSSASKLKIVKVARRDDFYKL